MRGRGRGVWGLWTGAALSERVKKSILNFCENIDDSDVFSYNDTKHPHTENHPRLILSSYHPQHLLGQQSINNNVILQQ
jgi:hypothetical protein